jgi:hypothetical protein
VLPRHRPLLSALLAIASLTSMMIGALTAPASAARSTSPRPGAVDQRVVGLAVAGAPSDLSEVSSISSRTGATIEQVTFYAAWSKGGDFPAADASRIAATGAVPELTWEPWDPTAGLDQPAYALDTIAAGAHHAYLNRWAKQVKAWGGPLVIRFAHEMNGNWYPWAEGVNGNGPGDLSMDQTLNVGIDRGTPVSQDYAGRRGFPYTGRIVNVDLEVGDDTVQPDPEDLAEAALVAH